MPQTKASRHWAPNGKDTALGVWACVCPLGRGVAAGRAPTGGAGRGARLMSQRRCLPGAPPHREAPQLLETRGRAACRCSRT